MGRKHHITLPENIGLKDSVTATSWLAPQFFLEEFESYKQKYFQKGENKDLVMAYILLQFYLENHFHYYLRFLIGGGFSSLKVEEWNGKCGVKTKLDWFRDHLVSNSFVINGLDFEFIKDNYQAIADIRNSFAHGHPVTETSNGGVKVRSEAKDFLTRQKFNEIRGKANQICELWNKIMTEVQNQKSLLKMAKLPEPHFFNNCKFEVF